MAKFPEAQERFFRNTFVCRRCKLKIRIPNLKIIQGKGKCRKCNRSALRPVRKK